MQSTATIQIDGMHCDACVRRARAALVGVEGFRVVDVRVGSAEVEIDPAKTRLEAAIDALGNAGFSAQIS